MKIRRANLFSSKNKNQDPVVQRVISTNPELNLNLNPGFFISLFNSLLGKFSLFFLEHPMIKLQAKRFDLNILLKLSDMKSNSIHPGLSQPSFGQPRPGHNNVTTCYIIAVHVPLILF